jgi:hypothetical protein
MRAPSKSAGYVVHVTADGIVPIPRRLLVIAMSKPSRGDYLTAAVILCAFVLVFWVWFGRLILERLW